LLGRNLTEPLGTRVVSRGIGLSFQGPRGEYSRSGSIGLVSNLRASTNYSITVDSALKATIITHFNLADRRPQLAQASGLALRDLPSRGEGVYGPTPMGAQAKLSRGAPISVPGRNCGSIRLIHYSIRLILRRVFWFK